MQPVLWWVWKADVLNPTRKSLTMGSTYNHYSVRWNSHHSHLTTMLTTLMRTETLCDITLVCDDGTVKAHQNILSACSPFFSRLFEANQQPHPLIYMRDMKVQEMRTLLDFMYEGEVIVDKHNMPSFFKAAMDLQLQVLEHIETAAAEQDLQCERDTLTASTSTNSESKIFRSNNCSQLELLHDNDQPKKQPSPAGPDTTVQQIFDNTDNDLPTEINCTPDCGRLTTEDRSANTVKNKKKRKLTTTCTNSAESAFAPLNERQAVHDVKPSPHTNSDENTNPNNELQVQNLLPLLALCSNLLKKPGIISDIQHPQHGSNLAAIQTLRNRTTVY
uniref:BTB domain-containing protein n=1 Tax=Anopheles culicifacies TaxID=139723 RepID=A0A182MP65_9DIPT